MERKVQKWNFFDWLFQFLTQSPPLLVRKGSPLLSHHFSPYDSEFCCRLVETLLVVLAFFSFELRLVLEEIEMKDEKISIFEDFVYGCLQGYGSL